MAGALLKSKFPGASRGPVWAGLAREQDRAECVLHQGHGALKGTLGRNELRSLVVA